MNHAANGVLAILPNDNLNANNQTDKISNTSTNKQIAGGQAAISGDTKIKNLGELQKKAPHVYNKMLEGIAMNICNEMKHHEERLKELRREYEEK